MSIIDSSYLSTCATPFNDDLVWQTIEEAQSLKRLNQAELEASKGKPTNTNYVRHAGFEKNKQSELAYLDSRLNKITDMRMQFGAVLPESRPC